MLNPVLASSAYSTNYEDEKDINIAGALPPESISGTTNNEKSSLVNARAAGAWIQVGSKWWYRHSDGSYTKNNWEVIDSKWYHFDREGWMQTGFFTDTDSKKYYLDPISGYMRVSWVKVGTYYYYFNGSGVMQTGWITLNSQTYYLKSNGVMVENQWYQIGGLDFKFNSSGYLTEVPSNRAVFYGFNYSDIDTVKSANNSSMGWNTAGFVTTLRTNVNHSDALSPYGTDLKTRLNSGIFCFDGHGNAGLIAFVQGPSYDQTFLVAQNGNGTTWLPMSDMNNCKLAVFLSCYSANTNQTSNLGNLLDTSISKGADTAIGFTETISVFSSNSFSMTFFASLLNGKSVSQSASAAANTVPVWDSCRKYVIKGNGSLVLKKTVIRNSNDLNNYYLSEEDKKSYILKEEYDDKLVYIKVIDGIETSDYYICDLEGNITGMQNIFNYKDLLEINNLETPLATSSDAVASTNLAKISRESENKLITNSSKINIDDVIHKIESFDVLEKINGKIHYIRIINVAYQTDGNVIYMKTTVLDLNSGEFIPYEEILNEYAARNTIN